MSLRMETYSFQEVKERIKEEHFLSGISAKEPRNFTLIHCYSAIEEKEKNQDIFSLASTRDHLFYGCRNH